MHIAFVTGNYPSTARPYYGTFVQQFVWAMARQENQCTVIKPTSMFDRRYGPYPPQESVEEAGGGARVTVHRPRYVSFSSRRFGWTHTGRWTQASFNQAVTGTVSHFRSHPDLLYGHFLYSAGFAATRAADKIGLPAVVGVGEGEFWSVEPSGFRRATNEMKGASAFLAVSTYIGDLLEEKLGIPREKVGVFPNGINRELFHPRDRLRACTEHGIPDETFNVVFVGAFVEQKGFFRLIAAVDGLEDVRLVLLGRGVSPAAGRQVAFQGPVPHDLVAELLCAGDVFVLPTRIEGSCNAVIEAMACGLPIVTSNGRYMDDIVDDEVAIRVDPMDVQAIRAAIIALKEDPERRRRMSEACLKKARCFDINERARRVTEWMRELVQRHERRGAL